MSSRHGGLAGSFLLALACSSSKPAVRGGDDPLTINELMAANALTSRDENGAASPWLELYNKSEVDVPLTGYALSDDPNNPRKAVFAGALSVAAHQYLVIWCDGGGSAGPAHVAVALSPSGGTVLLSRPDGSVVQQLSYGAQAVDIAAAREPDASPLWVIEWHASPGATNPAGATAAEAAPAAQPETVPAAGDVTERILGYDQVPEFALDIPPDSASTLRLQTMPSDNTTWVRGTLTFEGRAYGPVGVSLKGTRSFQPFDGKAAFRVDMKKYAKDARFFGLEELVLNNMTTDHAMIHERIAYWIARHIGDLPGLRANHALVHVNGQLYGLYANVEAPKKELVARLYPDAAGTLYSIHYADFQPQFLAGFQLELGPGGMADIQAVTDALAAPPSDQTMAEVARHVDLKEFQRYWAYCIVVGQFGSKWPYAAAGEQVGNDAGLYDDPSTHLMTFIPEGTDDTFYSADFDFRNTNSLLAETCKQSPACFQGVVNQVWSILDQLDQLNWSAEADRVAAQVAPYVAMDTRKPYDAADVAMYQQQMKYFMTGRRASVAKYIPSSSPSQP